MIALLSLHKIFAIAANFSASVEPISEKFFHWTDNFFPDCLDIFAIAVLMPLWSVPALPVPAHAAICFSVYFDIPNFRMAWCMLWGPHQYAVHWPNLLHPSDV